MKSLQHEIGKRQPFESPEEEAYLNLLRTCSVLEARFIRLFKTYSLSPTTYNILRILRGAGAEGRLCHEVGAQLVAQVPDVTRLMDRLETLGHLRRDRQSDDRRQVRVQITSTGLAVLQSLDGPVAELHKQQLGHISPQELKQLSALLVKLRSGCVEAVTE